MTNQTYIHAGFSGLTSAEGARLRSAAGVGSGKAAVWMDSQASLEIGITVARMNGQTPLAERWKP